jgi:ABC-2 type transport system ATP-binding protein
VPVTGGAKLLAEVIRELDTRGIEIDDIGLRRPTLDDVFLSLTGHVAEEKAEENGGSGDGRGGKGKDARSDKSRKEAAK